MKGTQRAIIKMFKDVSKYFKEYFNFGEENTEETEDTILKGHVEELDKNIQEIDTPGIAIAKTLYRQRYDTL